MRLRQFRDRWIQSVQYLQQIASSPARPRGQRERLQLLPSRLPPQPLLAAQAFVERHRLQLVHDPRARLHHPVPVPQQLPQIPILPARHPDLRKVDLPSSIAESAAHPGDPSSVCVLAWCGSRRRPRSTTRSSAPPAIVQTSAPAHWLPSPHAPSALCREIAIELLRFLAVLQSPFSQFTSFGIHKSNLLEARMVVATLYLVCICPIRSLCVSGGLDRDSAGGRSHP